MDPARVVFGLVPQAALTSEAGRVNALLRWIGERAGVMLVRRQVSSYDELVRLLRAGELQIAWLPPIPFSRLEADGVVRALVSSERGTNAYVSVLLTHADSALYTLDDVVGRSIGWVNPLSASGYVVPRARLAVRFSKPDIFSRETFFGSHTAVVRAVVERQVDVGAVYAGFEDNGQLVHGALREVGASPESVRVVESFGAIPPDVIAVHAHLDPDVERVLAAAFEATREDPEMLATVRLTFGALEFVRKPLVGYDMLRAEVEHGVDSGVIPAAAAYLSTRPPPPSYDPEE